MNRVSWKRALCMSIMRAEIAHTKMNRLIAHGALPENAWSSGPNSSSNTCRTSARSRATRTGSRAKLPRCPKQPPKRRQSRTEAGRHGHQGQERNEQAADKGQHGGTRPHHSGEMFRVHMPEEPELAREVAWREKGQSLLLEVWNGRGMDPAQGICARLVARLDPPMSHILYRNLQTEVQGKCTCHAEKSRVWVIRINQNNPRNEPK